MSSREQTSSTDHRFHRRSASCKPWARCRQHGQ